MWPICKVWQAFSSKNKHWDMMPTWVAPSRFISLAFPDFSSCNSTMWGDSGETNILNKWHKGTGCRPNVGQEEIIPDKMAQVNWCPCCMPFKGFSLMLLQKLIEQTFNIFFWFSQIFFNLVIFWRFFVFWSVEVVKDARCPDKKHWSHNMQQAFR